MDEVAPWEPQTGLFGILDICIDNLGRPSALSCFADVVYFISVVCR